MQKSVRGRETDGPKEKEDPDKEWQTEGEMKKERERMKIQKHRDRDMETGRPRAADREKSDRGAACPRVGFGFRIKAFF